MAGVTVLRQVTLFPPEFLGPEAQPDSVRSKVRPQRRQPMPQIRQTSSLVVHLFPSLTLSGIGNLTLGPRDPPTQTIHPQLLCSLTEDNFPSSDTRTPLYIRAGMLYRFRYSPFNDAAERPAATWANSFLCTRP